MTERDIAAPLAAALAAKGYASLTPVQEAVLAPDAAGRDALVSARTGSGKTVAFGLAVAPEVLAGAERLEAAEAPLALAIAPTRELALQVARELSWLYAEAGARIATCVGGMDYRTEKRALQRGAHIVVGTPGRLRDHIERGSLDLSALRACVLDEADEMLDLGFREDLEFILSAAPEGRRTLMFSATVPRGIADLAKTFQKDALRIETAGEARQHADIAYQALSVTVRDRDNAIFNLLRFHDAPAAIVFCRTRAEVGHLFARMSNRGFQAVALSGELSQAERTHALQALRDGRARVCIATDVAARGIDLPGLDLVVHADLPSNPETLLHRSGRTGRAGAKGVSALIVTPSVFKKAQRLLRDAKVVAEWGAAPSAEAVRARDDARILEHPALAEAPDDEAELVGTLLGRFGADRVAAAFVRLWREQHSAPEELAEPAVPGAPAAPRSRGDFGESVWFSVPAGRADRVEARWLLPRICDAGGITRDSIGAIRIGEAESFVQIAKPVAAGFGDEADLGRGLAMRRIEGEPVLERRAPAPRRERRPSVKPGGFDPAREAERDDIVDRAPEQVPPPRVVSGEQAGAGAPRKTAPRGPRVREEAHPAAARPTRAAPGPKAQSAKAKPAAGRPGKPGGKPDGKPGGKPAGAGHPGKRPAKPRPPRD